MVSCLSATASAQSANCNAPTPAPVLHIELPGNAFEPLPSADGCWIFVTMPQGKGGSPPGIAVLRRSNGAVALQRVIATPGNPNGAVLTHDGKLLIATAGQILLFVDVGRMMSGEANAVIGRIASSARPAHIYVNVTRDDHYAFVSDEGAETITVLDLDVARRRGFDQRAIIGTIPTGRAPIALTFSPDERFLYTTAQQAPDRLKWPVNCRPQGSDPASNATPDHMRGAIVVVDVARAERDPGSSVVATVPAGCNPVRLVLSPKGDVAYVTARTDNVLLAFDTERLRSDTAHALIASVPVGTAPVGIAVIDSGRKIVVTNSNRFAGAPTDKQYLTVVDATRMKEGAKAVIGTIAAGAFPREMRLTSDGRTLLLTNFASQTLQVIDLARLPLDPPR